MPKEFKDIHDPVTFLAFLDDVSVRTATLSNGDIKLDVMHGLKGGMPPKLDLSVKSSGTPFGADSLGKTQYTHAQAPTLSVGGGVMAEYVPGGLVTKTSIGPRFDDPNNSFAVTVEHATFNGKKAGATSYVFSGRINL